MDCASTTIQSLGSLEWNADVYVALSAVSNFAVYVKNKANVLWLSYQLRKMNHILDSLFEKINGALEGRIQIEPPKESFTPQQMRESAENLTRVYHIIETTFESARRVGLTNNSLTAGQFFKLRANGENALDVADWIETAIQEQQVEHLFNRAAQEKEHGETYGLSQVS